MANQLSFGGAVTSVARYVFMGIWSSTTTYQPLACVFDPASGASYVALTTNINTPVSNASVWSQMTAAGGVSTVAGKSGTVTLVSTDLSDHDAALGAPLLDASGFIKSAQQTVNANNQTGTTYAIAASDRGKLITFSNASPVAVSIAQATGSFAAGWYTEIENIGAGLVTITPTTSTVEGAAAVTLKQWESIVLTSAGGNYVCLRSKARVAIADLAAGTSAQLAAAISDGTGTGALVFGTSPTIATPAISSPTITGTATMANVTLGSGNTLTVASIKAISSTLFNVLDANGLSRFGLSNTAPYTNTFISGNGSGVVFLGSAAKTWVDDVTGNITLSGSTSGSSILKASAVAGAGTTLTLPAATDTLVGKATTDTLTNKTVGAGGIAGLTLGVTRVTASGTFTIPAGVTSMRCRVVGGGGAGGGTPGTASVNGVGGSSGGYGEKILTGLTPGNTLTITIGGGGAGVSNGTGGSGGTTTVASGTQTITSIVANGGNGGLVNGQPLAGASAGSGGDSNFGGSPGQTGFGINVGGNGAGAVFAGGGTAGLQGAGNAAGAPGSGGGGAGGNAGSASAGGAGAAGIVIFEYVT